MGGLAVLAHAFVLLRRGDRRAAVQLVATMTPGVVLAVWYVLAEHGGSGVTLYPSWGEKAIALTETLQLFLRLDPFPSPFPLFWVNLVLALAFAALVLSQLDIRSLWSAVVTRPVLWLSFALAVIALVLPISTVNDLIKPDERFVVPALMLAVAALPYRAVARRCTTLGPVLAAVVIALHSIEYTDAGQQIARVDAAIDATVPADTSVLHLVVPSRYGCDKSAGPVTGVPVLKWFAVDHALEAGPARVNIEETSLVHARGSVTPDITVLALDVSQVAAAALPTAFEYHVAEGHDPGDAADVAADRDVPDACVDHQLADPRDRVGGRRVTQVADMTVFTCERSTSPPIATTATTSRSETIPTDPTGLSARSTPTSSAASSFATSRSARAARRWQAGRS